MGEATRETVVICGRCGRFYNGAMLTQCPYCKSKSRGKAVKCPGCGLVFVP